MKKSIKLFLLFFSIISMFLYAAKQSYPVLDFDTKISINQDTLNSMDKILKKGIKDSAYAGFVFLGAQNGDVFYFENSGNFRYNKNSSIMEKSTIFDLASLTKVIATTSAAMLLYETGELKLDQKVCEILPDFANNGKENVTFYHLLTHTSGLPSWNPLFKDTNSPEEMIEKIFNMEQERKEGEKAVYSCLGFITLSKAIEKITGKSLDEYLDEKIFTPLKMNNTFFNPPKKIIKRIAPTEFDKERNGILQGFVHDENAYYLGGVSGNAGLFSTAEDLAIFCQMMLNDGVYDNVRIFKPKTVKLFTTKQNKIKESSRCLGWDTPSGHSSSGHYYSENSYGHTGFTGTAIWIDPEKKLFGIFLTNRVHPTRKNRKLYKMRFQVYDKLQQSIIDYPLIKNPNVY